MMMMMMMTMMTFFLRVVAGTGNRLCLCAATEARAASASRSKTWRQHGTFSPRICEKLGMENLCTK
eukprot:5560-Karenia_brevis.AAC.1